LKRQLISDLQNEELPTSEKYEAIVRLYKMEEKAGPAFSTELGITETTLRQALDFCEFTKK